MAYGIPAQHTGGFQDWLFDPDASYFVLVTKYIPPQKTKIWYVMPATPVSLATTTGQYFRAIGPNSPRHGSMAKK